ncbi:hypothetical protein [uncultured Maritimibacter sp.]|jgi:hypothetical protein|uniref:hypothetical protein n=1 Tax=uncultured Maritimibacter sp. TaxID=991866 RepID=UPI00261AEBEC|nr:hypothetical protein [uncultured Maritimibacter sp.]
MFRIAAFLPLVALAACSQPLQVNQAPVQYTATKPLYERGTSSFTVRVVNGSGRMSREMSGIPCTFSGDGFQSSFTAPAVVISPNLGTKTPVASVSCSFEGNTQTRPLQPINKTLQQIAGSVSTGSTVGAVGTVVGGAVAAVQSVTRKEDNDVYGYPDVEIVFQ